MVRQDSYNKIAMTQDSRTGCHCYSKVIISFPQTYWQYKHQFVPAADNVPAAAVYYDDICPEASQ